MPYTPPSQLSPVVSKSNSPAVSRSHSFVNGQLLSAESAAAQRPNLPRSANSSSYLSKHRRSPSLNDVPDMLYNGEAAAENNNIDPYGSLRQSPPPSNNALIPTGMTISPPDSAHNSSDEDEAGRGRGRQTLEAMNLKELQAAISGIEQRRESSPSRNQKDTKPASSNSEVRDFGADGRPPLSKEARKISHSRSSTDSNIVFDTSAIEVASSARSKQDSDEDEEDSDGTPTSRPSMVRKKSGELVRPALRPSSRRRPSSMPGTPTYSKAVHFDSHLEHVRHFLQVDRPLAVSAGSSPVEQYESENEFPFSSDEPGRSRAPPFEWEIKLANFPYHDVETRKSLPVHVERIFLSADNKTLNGSIVVQNLSFQKTVISRFTFDYWKTTSEVVAEYNHDIRRKTQDDGMDRFNFSLKLADQVNLENKTMFFCIRYTVGGQDYWDSNNGYNYQVDFSKKLKPQHGKNGMPGLGARPLNALPRSKPSPPTSSGQRPKSYPVSFDDFSAGFENVSLGQSDSSLIGEPILKLRRPRSKVQIVTDTPARKGHPASQAFGNRYDFNSSLTAAKNNAYALLGDQSGLTPVQNAKQSSRQVPAASAPPTTSGSKSVKLDTGVERVKAESTSQAPAVGPVPSKPAALLSEKPSLASQSYQELVEKYCFVGARGKSEQVRTH